MYDLREFLAHLRFALDDDIITIVVVVVVVPAFLTISIAWGYS